MVFGYILFAGVVAYGVLMGTLATIKWLNEREDNHEG